MHKDDRAFAVVVTLFFSCSLALSFCASHLLLLHTIFRIEDTREREKRPALRKVRKANGKKLNSFHALPFGTYDRCQFSSWLCSVSWQFYVITMFAANRMSGMWKRRRERKPLKLREILTTKHIYVSKPMKQHHTHGAKKNRNSYTWYLQCINQLPFNKSV